MKKQENEVLDGRALLCAKSILEAPVTIAETIQAKLTKAFLPSALSIEDESARHQGHAGARPEGETHFRVRIVSTAFEGLSRVERQRRIYAVLTDELRDRVHALALTALTVKEAERI
ncbi:MAG TPA: BolA family protein [Rhizomicrobium sp.]|nr:BolA family protein [Rhizomicrobium sp.]